VHVAVRIRRGTYADSVALMRIAEEARALPGVSAAALLMGTEPNRASLVDAGLWSREAESCRPDDLVMAVRAESADAAHAALARMETLLSARRRTREGPATTDARSLTSAARRAARANLAVISVPGPHAAAEAHQALSAGLHVFIFSDDMPIADEVALKQRGRARDLLVMGPECGTSIIGGIGLGFANRVRRGPIGLVGASGTGLQEISSLVHTLGGGLSHAIGTGGRDFQAEVGGLTTLHALELLADDDETRAIVLVSKPAAPDVADRVLFAAAAVAKPVIACLPGWRGGAPATVRSVETLEDAAMASLDVLGLPPRALPLPSLPDRPRAPASGVLGLYTGGTLCEEARAIVGEAAVGFTDFGADVYTRGRPHPMIDPTLRTAAIATAGDDPRVGVVLLDVVLGECAHPDPAGAAAAAIRDARARAERAGRRLDVVVHVVGTDEDPQGLIAQEKTLRALGAVVCPSNRAAALAAHALARGHHG
jgi:FdrA protein